MPDTPATPADTARERWISGALALLGEQGVTGVRIEVLARRLGVTKGGFYWHFKDRDALLADVLAAWVDGRRAAVAEETRLRANETVCQRLTTVIGRMVEKRNRRGLAIELAIRDWARGDKRAAAAVAAVDGARLEHSAALLRHAGFPPEEAELRAFLLYAVMFGQALITLPGEEAARNALRGILADRCAKVLTAGVPAPAPSSAPSPAQPSQAATTSPARAVV